MSILKAIGLNPGEPYEWDYGGGKIRGVSIMGNEMIRSILIEWIKPLKNFVMTDVSSVTISDFENTLSFPSEETSLGSGLPSHLHKGDVPYPSSPSHGFLHHIIGTLNIAM